MDPTDPQGYFQLGRYLAFIAGELGHAGLEDAKRAIDGALAYRGGSPTEYVGESLFAIRYVLGQSSGVPRPLIAFMSSLADEIDVGQARTPR